MLIKVIIFMSLGNLEKLAKSRQIGIVCYDKTLSEIKHLFALTLYFLVHITGSIHYWF